MDTHQLVLQGNHNRNEDKYSDALRCYAESFLIDHGNKHAWNNYGNVLREIGEPTRAVPFLEHAIAIDPDFVTAHFNLAIAHLLAGNYTQGWQKYEWRWRYEHLDGTLPKLPKPRWTGQDLKDKTILVLQEQGFGDIIMMSRFLHDLYLKGCKIKFQVLPGLVRMFKPSFVIDAVSHDIEELGDYDYWTPIMRVSTTSAPSAANRSAMPAPIPRLEPVTSARRPRKRSPISAGPSRRGTPARSLRCRCSPRR